MFTWKYPCNTVYKLLLTYWPNNTRWRCQVEGACDDFTRGHIVEVCRDSCAERSVGGADFESCVRACVEELKAKCGA